MHLEERKQTERSSMGASKNAAFLYPKDSVGILSMRSHNFLAVDESNVDWNHFLCMLHAA